jgi:hypothetical protein
VVDQLLGGTAVVGELEVEAVGKERHQAPRQPERLERLGGISGARDEW